MKTRRILAASTAALLAFGTTAAYVASATAAATEVTDAWDLTTGTSSATVKAGNTLKLTLTGTNGDTPTASPSSSGEFSVSAADGDGTAVSFTGVTNGTALTADAVLTFTDVAEGTIVVTYTANGSPATTYTITVGAADEENPGDEEGGDELTTTLFVDFNSDGEATLLSDGDGAIKSVKASISDKAAAKFDTDDYENYKIYGAVDSIDFTGGKVDVSDDQANDTIKGLDKPLKREVGKIKTGEIAIVNINIADGDKVKTSTPEPVTFTIRTSISDPKVYHVSGKTVEAIKCETAKIVGGNTDVTFTTKNFSPFIITKATLANAGATTSDGTPTSTATSDGATSTNPDTGIALAIAPVVLAAGAVAVVALKKKH